MHKLFKLGLIGLSSLTLIACGNSGGGSETIRVATSQGPYSELFLEEVAPILEAKGYKLENTEFSDVRSVNVALQEGSVDLNVDQNSSYMENYNKEADAKLTALTPIPTVPMAIYPANKTSLETVKPGDRIAIPDDPSNLTRALLLLEKAGWLTLPVNAAVGIVTTDDIIENKKNVEIIPMASPTIPRSLSDLDYAVIPGAIVDDSDLDFDTGLMAEDVLGRFLLQVVVSEENKDEEWAQAVVDVYQSDELKAAIEEKNNQEGEANWIWPGEAGA